MGLDVELHVRGRWTDKQRQHAEALLNDRLPDFLMDGKLVPRMINNHELIADAITLTRWYGPGYERGHWPTIYAAIRILQHCFPSCAIHYGNDAQERERILPVTDADLEHLWRHFLSPLGNNYRGSAV